MDPKLVLALMSGVGTLLIGIGTIWGVKRARSRSAAKPTVLGQNSAEFVNSPTISPTINIHVPGAPPTMALSASSIKASDGPHVAPSNTSSQRTNSTAKRKEKSERDLQRDQAKYALSAINDIVTTVHEFAVQYQKPSKSPSPFASRISALNSICRLLAPSKVDYHNLDLIKAATQLDQALNKLDVQIEGSDPRDILFVYFDPFQNIDGPRTIDGMIGTFVNETRRIAVALARSGFPVLERQIHGKSYRWYELGPDPEQV